MFFDVLSPCNPLTVWSCAKALTASNTLTANKVFFSIQFVLGFYNEVGKNKQNADSRHYYGVTLNTYKPVEIG